MDYKTVARNISIARKSAGLTQSELGEMVGTTQRVISKYELGNCDMSISRLLDICKALGISPADVFREL